MGASAQDRTSAPNERPSHVETVPPFYMDKLEITVDAYRACVDKRACKAPEKSSALCTYELGDGLLPVSCVHWGDADTYCRSVGKRLPRESEWELAARGTAPSARFPWGPGAGGCNFAATLLHESTGRSCTGKRPSRVGTHLSGQSPYGVLDMSGNVEEWVSDFYVEHIAEGVAPRSGASRVLRGGGWLSPPSMTRATSRNWGSALEAGPNVGFRCAKDKD
jgi:formylglycine-generating enzyme required for sulfatase activity